MKKSYEEPTMMIQAFEMSDIVATTISEGADTKEMFG